MMEGPGGSQVPEEGSGNRDGSDDEEEDQEPASNRSQAEQAEEQAEGEGAASNPSGSSSVRSIEYNPSLLQDNDPFGSMKPDVYTDVVPTSKRPSLPGMDSSAKVSDPMDVLCDTIFEILLSAIHSGTESAENSTLPDHLFQEFPYFDIVFKTTERELVPANSIFLARCPDSFQMVKLTCISFKRTPLQVPLKRSTLVKALRLLYSTDTQWFKPSHFEPEEYREIARLFGEFTERPNDTLTSLPDHLETFVCSKLLSDAWIKSGNFKTPIHKVILCGRSTYFIKAFSPLFLSSRTGETELKGVSSAVIVALLDYLYTGRLESATGLEVVVDMLEVANEIQDEVLCEACCRVVASNIDLDNVCLLYHMSRHISQPELQWSCTRFILSHYHSITPSLPGYDRLSDTALKELELTHEALLLNPVGRGEGFGDVREVIGTLREACFCMEERLNEAQESHAQAVWGQPSANETKHSLQRLKRQEDRVTKMQHFLAALTQRFGKLVQ